MASHQFSLKPSLIVRGLGCIAFLLVLVNVAGQLLAHFTKHNHLFGLIGLFNLDAEQNIPAFFSMLLLLGAAVLLTVIAFLERSRAASGVLYWALLAGGFFFMAADEVLSFHESASLPVRKLFGGNLPGVFYLAWVLPAMLLVFILGLFFLKFWLRLPAQTKLVFGLAAVTYLGGAIGFEMLGSYYFSITGHASDNFIYSLIASVEEGLEMAGVIIFIGGLLTYLANHYPEIYFRFETTPWKKTPDLREG